MCAQQRAGDDLRDAFARQQRGHGLQLCLQRISFCIKQLQHGLVPHIVAGAGGTQALVRGPLGLQRSCNLRLRRLRARDPGRDEVDLATLTPPVACHHLPAETQQMLGCGVLTPATKST